MSTRMRVLIFSLILLTAASVGHGAPAPHDTKVLIQIDRNHQVLRVEKIRGKSRRHINGQTLPVVKESLQPGWYRPSRIKQHFRSINGNVYLENVIFFDGNRTIRTTRLYKQMLREQNRIAGSVVLEPDFGQILFETVKRYGMSNTWIYVRK